MGMFSKLADLLKKYKCWRITGDLDFPMEDCKRFDENTCFYYSPGEVCPAGLKVNFKSDDDIS